MLATLTNAILALTLKIYKNNLTSLFDSNNIDTVTYQVWQQTDRSSLKTEVADSDDFVEELCNKLQNLKPHAFYVKQKALFLKHLKISLKEGEFLILLDFA